MIRWLYIFSKCLSYGIPRLAHVVMYHVGVFSQAPPVHSSTFECSCRYDLNGLKTCELTYRIIWDYRRVGAVPSKLRYSCEIYASNLFLEWLTIVYQISEEPPEAHHQDPWKFWKKLTMQQMLTVGVQVSCLSEEPTHCKHMRTQKISLRIPYNEAPDISNQQDLARYADQFSK